MTDHKTPNHAHDAQSHGRLKDGIDAATSAYETARMRAAETVDRSRERAQDAARRTADAIESNPVGVLVGGLALGALVASVLPRSQRERDLLAPVGRKVGAATSAALAAAKETGREELTSLGLTKGSAQGQAKSLLANIVKAATTAGKAAADAGRAEARGA